MRAPSFLFLRLLPGLILCLALPLSSACSCGDDEAPEPTDAGEGDANMDAGRTFVDAGPRDATIDSGFDAGPPPPYCETGMTQTFVLAVVDVATADPPPADPMIVPGFDLDGRVSDAMDINGCRHPDFTSPPPDDLMGVDNQMGPVLAALMSTIDVSMELQNAIDMGVLIFLARVSGIDDYTDDDCIDLEVLFGLLEPGVTMPMLDGMGRLAPDQTFDIDLRSVGVDGMTPLVRFPRGQIVGGRLQATSVTPFMIVVPTGGRSLPIVLKNPETRFNITPTGLSLGVLGGSLEVNSTVAAVGAIDPSLPVGLVRALLLGEADMAPNGMGQCADISIGFIFDGTTATEGVIR